MQERANYVSIQKVHKNKRFVPLSDELKKVDIAMLFCNELTLKEMENLRDMAFPKKVPNV